MPFFGICELRWILIWNSYITDKAPWLWYHEGVFFIVQCYSRLVTFLVTLNFTRSGSEATNVFLNPLALMMPGIS